jgi:hypothetical protein
MMARTFTRKGYGRIYVTKQEDISRVKAIIEKMDAEELRYLPQDLIAEFSEYPKVVYSHKFCDLDLNGLQALCMKEGISIFCFDNGSQEYAAAYVLPEE